jgi:predicted RNA binding protein YcfA (HicA-like mRNA interferase family)
MPSPVRFGEVRKVLEAKGYTLSSIAGSHHKFTKAGVQPVSIPVHHNLVKNVYYKIAQKAP